MTEKTQSSEKLPTGSELLLKAAPSIREHMDREIRAAVLAEREACAAIARKEWQEASSLCRSQCAGDLMRRINDRSLAPKEG